jgi:hypothetical protein
MQRSSTLNQPDIALLEEDAVAGKIPNSKIKLNLSNTIFLILGTSKKLV